MPWVYLIIAILLEVSGTTCMKLSDGFRNPLPSVCVFGFYVSSIFFLTLAIRTIQISVAYAVWSAVGTAIIALIGFQFFGEPMTSAKIAFLSLIIIGVAGLNLVSS